MIRYIVLHTYCASSRSHSAVFPVDDVTGVISADKAYDNVLTCHAHGDKYTDEPWWT